MIIENGCELKREREEDHFGGLHTIGEGLPLVLLKLGGEISDKKPNEREKVSAKKEEKREIRPLVFHHWKSAPSS